MICRIILWISLLANFALYFGWIDVWQYRTYVDKSVEFSKEMSDEQKRKEFLQKDWVNVAKDTLAQKYQKDLDKLKEQLKWKTEDQVKTYLKQNFTWLTDNEINFAASYIKSNSLSSSSSLK